MLGENYIILISAARCCCTTEHNLGINCFTKRRHPYKQLTVKLDRSGWESERSGSAANCGFRKCLACDSTKGARAGDLDGLSQTRPRNQFSKYWPCTFYNPISLLSTPVSNIKTVSLRSQSSCVIDTQNNCCSQHVCL